MNSRLVCTLAAIFLGAAACGTAWAAGSSFGADRHVARGVPCKACHGPKQEIAFPSIDQCSKCHNPDEVAKKTANAKPRNPHVSPHYDNKLDCVLCHVQHAKTEDYCAQCHKFGFKVP